MNDARMTTGQDEISEQLHLFQIELSKYIAEREKHARRMTVLYVAQLVLLVTTPSVTILKLFQ